jgi:plasmid replication DNA-binding protein KfrA
MGRTGVTLHEVEKAVLQLQGRGKNPSVDAVREVIGTGSKSTLSLRFLLLNLGLLERL